MKNAKRIILVTILLIGGTLIFGYWSLRQFDLVFNNTTETSITKSIFSIFSKDKKNEVKDETNEEFPAPIVQDVEESPLVIETNIITNQEESEERELNLTFFSPVKENNFFIGCKYNIIWRSEVASDQLVFSLVDAGMRKKVSTFKSGMPENTTITNAKSLEWKVGDVWPGRYYVLISGASDEYLKKRSEVFEIKQIPQGTSPNLIADFCKK